MAIELAKYDLSWTWACLLSLTRWNALYCSGKCMLVVHRNTNGHLNYHRCTWLMKPPLLVPINTLGTWNWYSSFCTVNVSGSSESNLAWTVKLIDKSSCAYFVAAMGTIAGQQDQWPVTRYSQNMPLHTNGKIYTLQSSPLSTIFGFLTGGLGFIRDTYSLCVHWVKI